VVRVSGTREEEEIERPRVVGSDAEYKGGLGRCDDEMSPSESGT
jgi:hypothetical protein